MVVSPPIRCNGCGLTSNLREAFQHGGGPLCPLCWHKYLSAIYRNYLVCGVLTGLIGLLILYLSPGHALGWFLLAICLFVEFQPPCMIVHELGHALIGWLLGMKVIAICFGLFGRTVLAIRFFGCTIEVHSVPVGGFTSVLPRSTLLVRTKDLLVTLGGPLANCALIVGGWSLMESVPSEGVVAWASFIFVLTNAAIVIKSVWPWSSWFGDERFLNDGRLILRAFFVTTGDIEELHASYFVHKALECQAERSFAEAMLWIEKGIKRYPNDENVRHTKAILYLDLRKYHEAREIFLKLLDRKKSPPESEATLWNNIAWSDVMIGSIELRQEADRFSQQAFERIPWRPTVTGTRGSVLVEIDRLDEGITLLQSAFDRNPRRTGRALNACYLAIAMARKGNQSKAKEFLNTARQLDADCPLVERVEAELAGRKLEAVDQA